MVSPEVVLLGILPIKVVKNITHTLGSTAVGYAVGNGVRVYQPKNSLEPERVQLNCSFLDADRYSHKLILDSMHYTKIPFPFVSGLAAISLVTIESLVYMQNASRKSFAGGAVIDFVITLSEYKANIFTRIGSKVVWALWTSSTHKDVGANTKLIPTYIPINESATTTTETITMSLEELEELSIRVPDSWTTVEISAAHSLNSKFDLLPFNADGVFPQSIKLRYPPTPEHAENFNTFTNIPDQYEDYCYLYPDYDSNQNVIIEITIIVKQTQGSIYTTMKIVDIKVKNIQPVNLVGGIYGSKLIGGIRLL